MTSKKRENEIDSRVFLYDPRINVTSEITVNQAMDILNIFQLSKVQRIVNRMNRIRSVGCYLTKEPLPLKTRKLLYEKERFQDEVWVEIENCKKRYMISNHGRFKRLYKNVEPKLMLPFQRKQCGNLFVKVTFQGVYKDWDVSHLVAYHFIGIRREGHVVRRKNGIKTDNFAGNLEYISRKELGVLTGPLSRSKPVVQFDAETMEIIDEYRSVREAGRRTFTSYQSVLDNCNGKTKVTAGNYKFRFLDEFEELVNI